MSKREGANLIVVLGAFSILPSFLFLVGYWVAIFRGWLVPVNFYSGSAPLASFLIAGVCLILLWLVFLLAMVIEAVKHESNLWYRESGLLSTLFSWFAITGTSLFCLLLSLFLGFLGHSAVSDLIILFLMISLIQVLMVSFTSFELIFSPLKK